MYTLETFVASNASAIVKDERGRLLSITCRDPEEKPIELHGNSLLLLKRIMSEGQAIVHNPVYGDIVHSSGGERQFKDAAAVREFLEEKQQDYLRKNVRLSTGHQQALNFLGLLKQLLPA